MSALIGSSGSRLVVLSCLRKPGVFVGRRQATRSAEGFWGNLSRNQRFAGRVGFVIIEWEHGGFVGFI